MPLRDVLQSRRVRRLLGLALLCGLILIGGRLLLDEPVKIVVVYELGATAPGVRALVATDRAPAPRPGAPLGDVVLRKRYNYGDAGAPAAESHQVRLKRGAYALEVTLETTGGPRTVTRDIEVRGGGDVLRVSLR
ncbi:MAG: hypothetical protein HY906_16230 [Deltaproteobacteria bacterium]|nr:hypothetical protein [Deltaproteobacteria bacterium]